MSSTKNIKKRISITILPVIDEALEKISNRLNRSKSSIVEEALKALMLQQLDEDSQALSKLNLDDLPSEDEWSQIQLNQARRHISG